MIYFFNYLDNFMYSYSLKELNTFNLNINANKIFFIEKLIDFKKIFFVFSKEKKILFLGKGSNVLFLDDYYGIVFVNKIKGIKLKENIDFWFLDIYSGELWSDVVSFTLNNGIFGLENLSFIPGTIGGAIVNNIGAYGLEISYFVYYIKVLDIYTGLFYIFNNKQCCFSYRYSIWKNINNNRFFIIKIGLKIKKKWNPYIYYKDFLFFFDLFNTNISVGDIYDRIFFLRKLKIPDPNYLGNVGSIFKNPIIDYSFYKKIQIKYNIIFSNFLFFNFFNKIKISAAWLIDMCGLKGYTIGGAQIYSKQPLIIINKGWSLPEHILFLINLIKKKVLKKFNILLELEINIIKNN